MNKIKEVVKERKFKFIVFFWIIISIQFIVGSNLQTNGHLPNNLKDVLMSLLKIILLSVVFIVLHYCILELFKRAKIERINEKNKEIKSIKFRWFKYFLIIFVCWIPTVLAFYPCILGYDGGYQIRDYVFYNSVKHHPVLITKLYSTFYVVGIMLKSPTFGMFLFSIFQMAFMAVVFSYTVKFIEDQTQKKWIRNLSILFYALYPYNQLFSITTTKDVIFAGLMLVFIIQLYRMVKEKYKIADYIFIVVIGIIMLLSRNNAIYTLKVSLPFIILVLIRDRSNLIKVISTFLIIIIVYQNMSNYLFTSVDGKNDEGNLRVSTFSQAIGRVVRDKKEELTQEEKEKISFYFKDYEKIGMAYTGNIADSTTDYVNTKNINENKSEFFKFIFELGKKYPITYLESFLDTTRGYWYIQDVSFSKILRYQHPGAFELYDYGIAKGEKKVVHDSKLPALKEFYRNMYCLNEYQNIPILYILFQPGIYFYSTLAFLLYAIYKKEKSKLVIAIFLFTFYASCYLAQCSIIRYMYPVMVSMPFILALVNKKEDEKV